MTLYVDVSWSRFCDEQDPEARYVVDPSDIDRLGLRAAYDLYVTPPVAKSLGKPEDKEMSAPANKAARRPSTK